MFYKDRYVDRGYRYRGYMDRGYRDITPADIYNIPITYPLRCS
jgi:hypothetical protein